MAELEARGMHRSAIGTLEVRLSARFTGWVGLSAKSLTLTLPAGRTGVLVAPRIGIRDEETSRLVARLRGLSPDDAGAQGHSLVMKDLNSLIPERGSLPPEWVTQVTHSEAEAEVVARRIADDVVRAGFPYMESTASPQAYFAEFKEQVWKLLWPQEAAVIHMMHGELDEAKRMLMSIARPIAQQPTAWAGQDLPSAGFFDAFSAHFGVALGIEEWPVKGD
jgi:hypothetical protein